MALTDLNLKLHPCISNKCKTIQVTDCTGVYNDPNNLNGWGTPIAEPNTITSAVINIYLNDTLFDTVDVLDNIPDVATESYSILSKTYDNMPDGEYYIVLTLSDGSLTATGHYRFFNTCNVRCCVDAMWTKALSEEGDCGCSGKNSATQLALQGEALLKLIKNASSCMENDARDEILRKLQRICKMEKCKCN